MKKLVTLFLAAGMLLTSVAGASAVEFRPSGELRFGFFASGTTLGSYGPFQDHDSISHNLDAPTGFPNQVADYEPVRTSYRMYYSLNLDFIANEQLSGRIGIKSSEKGFSAGAWESNFFVNTAYIDWYIPNTPVQVRMGRWNQGTMNFTGTLQMLSPVVPNDGVRLSAKINDNITLTGIWWRRADGRDDGVGVYDTNYADQFYLEVPMTFDGIRANVWGTYIRDQHSYSIVNVPGVGNTFVVGAFGPGGAFSVPLDTAKYATFGTTAIANIPSLPALPYSWDDSRVFAFGAGISVSKFSPFVIAADFGYSNLEVDGLEFDATTPNSVNAPNAFDRKGWYLSGRVSYNTAFGTPSLFAWYTSGDDDDLSNGSERPLGAGTAPSAIFGLFGSDWNSKLKLAEDPDFSMIGTWGVSAQWSNISFVKDLTHHVALSYIRGTNDPFMARFQNISVATSNIPQPHRYMTTEDSAVALELSNSYQIYKELTMAFDMFYVWQNFDSATWSKIVGNAGPNGAMVDRLPLVDGTSTTREVEFSNAWGIGLSFTYAF